VGLERKIHKNQELRVKHSDDPTKFMESEIELFEEINKLQAVATAPELYVEFVKLNGVARVSRPAAASPRRVLRPPAPLCPTKLWRLCRWSSSSITRTST
jgi:hypothetical protein